MPVMPHVMRHPEIKNFSYPFFAAQRMGTPKKGILFVHFFARSKETNQRKGAQQLGLRLPSRNARTRGRQELAHLGAQTACRPYSARARFARHRCNGVLKPEKLKSISTGKQGLLFGHMIAVRLWRSILSPAPVSTAKQIVSKKRLEARRHDESFEEARVHRFLWRATLRRGREYPCLSCRTPIRHPGFFSQLQTPNCSGDRI